MSLRSFFLSLWLSTVCLCTVARAQFGAGNAVLRGEIEGEGAFGEGHVVNISDCQGGETIAQAVLGLNYKFEFHNLKPGCKIVRILSSDERRLLHEEQLTVDGDGPLVTIHVSGDGSADKRRAAGSPTVSAERLRHPIPPKTVHALAEAQKLSADGRLEEAASKLQKMVAQDPNLWEAQLNLGAVEMRLGQPEKALGNFARVRELEPRSSMAALDSAIALIGLHRVTEAEAAAREALVLDPSNRNAQNLLDRLRIGRERGYVRDGASGQQDRR